MKHEKPFQKLPEFIQRFITWILQGQPPKFMIQPLLFLHLRRRGVPVWFMTVNDEESLRLAISAGATGILTDKPGHMINLLEEKSLRFRFLYE